MACSRLAAPQRKGAPADLAARQFLALIHADFHIPYMLGTKPCPVRRADRDDRFRASPECRSGSSRRISRAWAVAMAAAVFPIYFAVCGLGIGPIGVLKAAYPAV